MTPIFELYVVRCGSKIWQKEKKRRMFLKEIELHVQNLLTIRDSIVNMVVGGGGRGPIWPLNEHINIPFEWSMRYSHELQKLRGKSLQGWLGFANQGAIIVCFISYEK